MADGSRQHGFGFRPLPVSLLRPGEITVDLFCGGGGASEAIEEATGRPVDIAINHDAAAIGMHSANHALTKHVREDIRKAQPLTLCNGRPVGWMHLSSDCTHFSQAKGGQPRSVDIRSLSWMGMRWAGTVRPRKISLENVWQVLKWGPLIAKRDKVTGRVIRLDGTVAPKGERTPLDQQFLVPDKRREGETWRTFLRHWRGLGYTVEYRKLVACDYGAGTTRERLFAIGSRDGEPIHWPKPTHGPGLKPYVKAADCIDLSDLGRSIFGRTRPLAEATMRRIAKGVVKHVIEAKEPFFITEFANAGHGGRTWSSREPLRTQCAQVKGGHFAVVSAFLERACGGYYSGHGSDLRDLVPTICAKGSIQRLVSTELTRLAPDQETRALRVAAFLINYYGNGTALSLRDPLDTITTRDRMALVTVLIENVPHVITDIRLRMLKPRELYTAQGFRPDYVIDRTADGRILTITEQVRMVGNSVSPPPMRALIEANLDTSILARAAA